MPPVADKDEEGLLAQILRANEGTHRPSSLRSLARALAEHPDSNQNFDSWLKTVRRINKGSLAPSLVTRALLVDVLRCPASALPAPGRVAARELLPRLEELEAAAVSIGESVKKTQSAIQGLQSRLRDVESRLATLEDGSEAVN